jgi:hypothetical protein
MSNDIRPNWLLSEDEVVDWLKAEPRTYNWQVLVALDRRKTNQLLLQEYIQRYSKDLYFDPITDSTLTSGDGTLTWQYLYDHVLGPPRLSFENSHGDEWARLTMPILGGLQLTVQQTGNGPKQVTRINWYDPLQAPRLICEIRLEDTSGEVNYGRKVELDLKKGTRFRTTFASTSAEQELGGKIYEGIFEEWPEEKQRFTLGHLSEFESGSVLEPDKFRLRALSAQPARAGEREGAQEGAVLLFIGTKGNDPGQTPDKDEKWVYPIPVNRSSTMLVANSLIIEHLMAPGLTKLGVTNIEYELIKSDNGAVATLHFTDGRFWPVLQDTNIPDYPRPITLRSRYFFRLDDGPEGVIDFRMNHVGDEILMIWRVVQPGYETDLFALAYGYGSAWYKVKWDLVAKYHFILDDQTGGAKFVKSAEDSTGFEMRTIEIPEDMQPYEAEITAAARRWGEQSLLDITREIAAATKELELFRVYGLIFTGSNVVQHQSIRMPCDLAVFGDISPTQTAYEVTPVEKTVMQGAATKFTVTPAQTGISWKLEEVPGFPFPLGSITQNGDYTAPKADQLPGSQNYTMVRVTATKGTHTSSALVRVVLRSVVINPMVVGANQTAQKVRFSGGSLAEGKLTWAVDSVTGATLTDQPPTDDVLAEFDEGDMFYVPGKGSSENPYSIDTLTVTDSAGNKAKAHLVLMEATTVSGTIVIMDQPGLPEGKIKLGLDAGKDIIPDDQVIWEVKVGGGSIDENGVYTVDTNSEYRYAVIFGTFDSPFALIAAYLILPVPLVDLDEVRRLTQ